MSIAELCRAPLSEVAPLIEDKSISPVELTVAMLDRIERIDASLHAYVHVAAEQASEAAKTAEARIISGDYLGPLHGIPLGIKDIFNTANMPTANGSPQFLGSTPDRNAFVVDRLNAAGAVLLGKQATAEFAFVAYNPAANPPPVNPWNADRWPGVSSGGSCVAVAASLCFGSFGTDTGGSIRYPSAANGIVGMKPTFGRISRRGVYPFSETLDHVGPLARSVRDVALLYQVIAAYDPEDPFCVDVPSADVFSTLDGGVKGLRMGVDTAYYEAFGEPEAVEATMRTVGKLEEAGIEIVPLNIREIAEVCHHWLTVGGIEALMHHGREQFKERAELYGRNVRELLEGGMQVTADDLARAGATRRRTTSILDAAFDTVDFLILPGMSSSAPPISVLAAEPEVPPEAIATMLAFSAPFNFSGHPTLSIPNAFDSEGMPLGVQLVGRPFDEAGLLKVGYALEQTVPPFEYPKP